MSSDKFESLKKQMNDRMEAASKRLNKTLGGPTPRYRLQTGTPQAPVSRQASLQAATAVFYDEMGSVYSGAPTAMGMNGALGADQPPTPIGTWRCIVNSDIVSIDVTATIAGDGTLNGQGYIVYVYTNKIYNVSGKGDWLALPPDQDSSNWLFKFRLHPSNHPIFSWFASPTDSPNHLYNRFVVPDRGSVVETNCERVS